MKRILLFGVLFTFFGCKKNILEGDTPFAKLHAAKNGFNLHSRDFSDSVNNENIKYFGRWDFSSQTHNISSWGGAYFKVNFTGTSVKIKVDSAVSNNYYAKIDDGQWTKYAGKKIINLTPTPLPNGVHTLTVAQGKDYYYVFNFQGLIFNSGATTSPPAVSNNLIEYIGDSITAGYTDPDADVSDYAWICSEALGAEHTQIAYPGINLVSGHPGTGMDKQYLKTQSLAFPLSPAWDFTKYTPKLVVCNLGTNDNNNKVTDASFESDYITFLKTIRGKFPVADIFLMRPFNGAKATAISSIVAARLNDNDKKVHYINTSGWLVKADYTDGLHPTASGQLKAANRLTPILAQYLSN